MRERPVVSGRDDPLTKRVTVIDPEKFNALVTERDLLLSAHLRRRIGTLVAVFILATAAALAGFWGGFAVSQRTNQESFKALCSEVVDQAMKKFEPRMNASPKKNRPPAASGTSP
jgi:hypothetical protein